MENTYNFKNETETICLHINLRNRKWLVLGIYKPPKQSDSTFISEIQGALNHYSKTYENIIVLGDFNMTIDNKNLDEMVNSYDLVSLIKEPTCYKGKEPSCIDLILTNQKTYL